MINQPPNAINVLFAGLLFGLIAGLLFGCYEEQCVDIAPNLCIDESIYEIENIDSWLDQYYAAINCAGLETLPVKTYVRVISNGNGVICRDTFGCYACMYKLFGDYEIEITTSGSGIGHELRHVIEDYLGICSWNDTSCNHTGLVYAKTTEQCAQWRKENL